MEMPFDRFVSCFPLTNHPEGCKILYRDYRLSRVSALMLSRKAEYALRASLLLANSYGQGPVLISELAQKGKIPKKFLEMILLELRNQGFLQSKKGKGGGYSLCRSPEAITVGELVRVIDGPLAPIPCVSETAYQKCKDFDDESICGIRIVMKRVRDSIAEILDSTSLADVLTLIEEAVEMGQESPTYHI